MGNIWKRYKEKPDIEEKIEWNNINTNEKFGEANICIKIAQWRARDLIKKKSNENFLLDTYIKLQNILSKLEPENWFIIDPRKEKWIIDHYNRPRRLREKFRSRAIDIFLAEEMIRAQCADEEAYLFRRKIFPYLPSYEPKTR